MFRRLSGVESSILDKTLMPLTHAANNSRLWFVLAALLATFGGRFGRRAALRGLMSLAITSVIVNLPAKYLAHRHRPDDERRRRRRLAILPASSSFPSGHSASAAAFATGVALELPTLAVPAGALAAATGFSRVYVGVHYPLDVLVGAALGVTAALTTRRWWPVASRETAQMRPTFAAAKTNPLVDGSGLVIFVNPSAGPALSRNGTSQIKDLLPNAEVIELDDDADLEAELTHAAQRCDALGVCGGDGSINCGAEVALKHDKPYAAIPGGTLNHLARDLGIASLEDAATAVIEGQTAAMDVGLIDGKPFLNTASAGAYVELVDARERLESRIGKWPAVIVALVTVLSKGKPLRVEIDGVPKVIWMIFIGNCRYHPQGFAPSWRERLDDGDLDLRIVNGSEPWSRTRLVLAVMTGRLGRSHVYEARIAKRIEIRSMEGPLRLARDGETFDGSDSFLVEKHKERLTVYVPGERT